MSCIDNGKTPKGEDAMVLALAAGRTIADAADLAGIAVKTVQRRLADPSIRRMISAARAEMVQRAMGSLSDTLAEAVCTLRKLLKAKGDMVKLSAARALLEYSLRFRESIDLEERLTQIEARFADKEGSR